MESQFRLTNDELDLSGFLTAVATAEPLPAGVAVAALTAALAAALAEMGAGLLLKGNHPEAAALQRVRSEAATWRAALLRAITEDSDAYRAYIAARALPRETAAMRRTREQALNRTRLATALTPLQIAGMAYDILGFLTTIATHTRPALRSDIATAAILAEAATRATAVAIRTNLRDHSDQTEAADLLAQADRLTARAATACNQLVALTY